MPVQTRFREALCKNSHGIRGSRRPMSSGVKFSITNPVEIKVVVKNIFQKSSSDSYNKKKQNSHEFPIEMLLENVYTYYRFSI